MVITLNIKLKEAIESIDFSANSLVNCGNGLFLTNYEIQVLTKYGISYCNCSSLKEVLFKVEELLNIKCFDDLEQVSGSIAERDYYWYSNK